MRLQTGPAMLAQMAQQQLTAALAAAVKQLWVGAAVGRVEMLLQEQVQLLVPAVLALALMLVAQRQGPWFKLAHGWFTSLRNQQRTSLLSRPTTSQQVSLVSM
jgi:hypothetical protein